MSSGSFTVGRLAHRFLFSKSNDSFLSLMTWVAVFGIALGVAALLVVTSVINGFRGELTRVITGMNSDVVLYSRGSPIRQPELVEEKLREVLPEMKAVTRSMILELMISGPNAVAGAALEGMDLNTVQKVTRVMDQIKKGRMPWGEDEIALGSALAEKVGAKVGDEVRLVLPFSGGSSDGDEEASGGPQVKEMKVVGIVKMGMYDYDSKYAFMPLLPLYSFLKQRDLANTFKIALVPGTDSAAISARLNEAFGYPFRAKNWQQLNSNIFYAIELEKWVIAIILTVIIVVAAFNVVSALMILIHDRSKEMSILKAMGLRASQSFGLFTLIGMGMGVAGTVGGILIGTVVAFALRQWNWIELPADIYSIDHLPIQFSSSELVTIAGVSLLISLSATLFPALQIARRAPLEGMKYD